MPLSWRASFCCGCVQLQCGSIIAYDVYVPSPYNPEFQMIMIGTFPVQLDPFLVVVRMNPSHIIVFVPMVIVPTFKLNIFTWFLDVIIMFVLLP
eukprot:285095_1